MTEDEYKKYVKENVSTDSTVNNYVKSMKDLLECMMERMQHSNPNKSDPFEEFVDLNDLYTYLSDFLKDPNNETFFSEKLNGNSDNGMGSAALGKYIEKLQKENPKNKNNGDDIKAKIIAIRKKYNQTQDRTNHNDTDKQGEPQTTNIVTVPSTTQVANDEDWSHQIIFYGAPGTGKSTKIREHLDEIYPKPEDKEKFVFRTTFHPDYDYSAFVGSLKPKMKTDTNNNKEYISYQFVPGIFSKAYVEARKNKDKNVYLIIEEINRGNCAAIFGDIFQLLDRKNGESEYPIDADPDLSDFLRKEITERDTNDKKTIKLPKNLYIWATMNTSDQSLFPIDAAFKRRWQMEYVKNNKRDKGSITINGNLYELNEIIGGINKILKGAHLDDKEIGYYFLKEDELNVKCLVGKLIHYLYHDVYKPFGKPDAFKEDHSFDDLFAKDGKIDEKNLEALLSALGIQAQSKSNNSEPTSDKPNDNSDNQADSKDDANTGVSE